MLTFEALWLFYAGHMMRAAAAFIAGVILSRADGEGSRQQRSFPRSAWSG
ncbi:MAG TPA: hypothetical protein VER58_01670 [Thermoanaerobaculia bacterium]|nr:hypothetical protein [Thermoanaerobaculia bacterium]